MIGAVALRAPDKTKWVLAQGVSHPEWGRGPPEKGGTPAHRPRSRSRFVSVVAPERSSRAFRGPWPCVPALQRVCPFDDEPQG